MGNAASLGGEQVAECIRVANLHAGLLCKLEAGAIARGGNGIIAADTRCAELSAPPPSSEPLVQGWLLKQNENQKSWKARYFVVHMQSCEYYDRDTDGRPCGSVPMRGLVVEEVNSNSSPHTFTLRSRSVMRRAYVLRCGSATDTARWVAAFRAAAGRAAPPLLSGSIRAAAFRGAYECTWRLLQLPGACCIDSPEGEQLAELLLRVLQGRREESAAPAAPEKYFKHLLSIAGSAWAAEVLLLDQRRPALEALVAEKHHEIESLRQAREGQLRGSCGAALARLVQVGATPVISFLLSELAPLSSSIYARALEYLAGALRSAEERGRVESELRELYADASWRDASLGGALNFSLLDAASAARLGVQLEQHGLSLQMEVWAKLELGVRDLLCGAVYSFALMLERDAAARYDIPGATQLLLQRTAGDARRSQADLLASLSCAMALPGLRLRAAQLPFVCNQLQSSVARSLGAEPGPLTSALADSSAARRLASFVASTPLGRGKAKQVQEAALAGASLVDVFFDAQFEVEDELTRIVEARARELFDTGAHGC